MKKVFSQEYQPSEQSRQKANKTKSLKLRLNVEMGKIMLKDVLSQQQLKELQNKYLPKYQDFEDFKNATAEEIIAFNFLKYIVLYDVEKNSENAMKMIKAIDHTTFDELKETFQPIFHFDKQEMLL